MGNAAPDFDPGEFPEPPYYRSPTPNNTGGMLRPDDIAGRTLEAEQKALQGMRMRALGYSWDQVARHVGYANRASARVRVMEIARSVKLETIEEFRAIEADRLDYLATRLMKVIEYKDYKITPRGEVARGPDGEFLEDNAARVNAIAELRRVSESKRRLFGVDAPIKTEITIAEKELNDEIRLTLQQLREVRNAPLLEAEVISDTEDPDPPELPALPPPDE